MTVLERALRAFQRGRTSSFASAVAKLFSGQMVAVAIPILAAPILGRLYPPADYGLLATYMAFATTLGVASSLQLQHAIFVERSEQRANDLVVTSQRASLIAVSISVVIAVGAVVLLRGDIGHDSERWWFVLLPLSTLAASSVAAIGALANRRQAYGNIAINQVVTVAATTATSIGLGVLGWGAHGLFLSYFVGQAATAAIYWSVYRRLAPNPRAFSRRRSVALIRRHRRFPIYTMPSEMLGTTNVLFPVYALGFVGAFPLLGAFTRARQLVSMPMQLLGNAIGQVFRQRAAADLLANGNCRPIFLRTLILLVAISVPPLLVLWFFAPVMFRIFLGPDWVQAGQVAQILAPMMLLQTVCSPLSTIFYITKRQSEDLLLNIGSFALIGLALLAIVIADLDPLYVVYAYSICFSVIYLVYIVRGWVLAGGGSKPGAQT